MSFVTMVIPQVGDIALHRDGLDGRRVTKVSHDALRIWIQIGDSQAGPFPASNYTFRREIGT